MWDKLGHVFDSDNPLMRALGIVADLLLLNLLTVLCLLPVVTYGAALTARNDVLWHMVRNEDSYIAASYFTSFKRNLKQGTVMGLIFFVPMVILFLEYRLIRAVPEMHSPIIFAMYILVCCFVLAVGIYSFALLSRYENSVLKTVKNAVLLSLAFFPRTLALLFTVTGFWLVMISFYQYLLPLALLLGLSLPGYICALIYNPVFAGIERGD